MKKTLLYFVLMMFASNISFGQWTVMDGSLLFENSQLGWVKDRVTEGVSDGPESHYYSIVDDPEIEGNKLIMAEKLTDNTRESWKLEWNIGNADNAFTFIIRLKPTQAAIEYSQTASTRSLYFSPRTGVYREAWSFYLPDRIESNFSLALETYDILDWNIFRFTMRKDSVYLYINEDPEPVFAGVTDREDADNFLLFGANVNGTAHGAYYDWMIWNLDDAYAPGVGPELPDTLTGLPEPISVRSLRSDGPSSLDIYPNPMHSLATITYSVEQAGHIRIDVYDMSGRHLIDLVDQILQPGTYHAVLNGNEMPSGLYLIRFNEGNRTSFRKFVRK